MRISELAKKLGCKSSDIIEQLEKAGVKGKKAASGIDDANIAKMEKKFKPSAKKKTAKKATAKKSTASAKTKKAKTSASKKSVEKLEAKPKKTTAKKTTVKAKAKPVEKVVKNSAPTVEAKPVQETAVAKEPENLIKVAQEKAKALASAKAEEEELKKKAEERSKRKVQERTLKKEKKELKEIERIIEEEEKEKKEAAEKEIVIDEAITVKELSEVLNLPINEVIKTLFLKGIPVTVNQTIGVDLAGEIATELGYTIVVRTVEVETKGEKSDLDLSHLPVRPPVVTVMGHVDHGKTSLLDAIRTTDVASKEAGGITQHIGASLVKTSDGNLIAFLDTPGHEAFTALRARGAQATDIVILVVAADDGVMPQTVEAIHHAKAADVQIIVAINKIDKPDAQPDKVKQELAGYDLVPEDWGGSTIYCNVSAKSGEGLDKLLEMLLLQAEILELHADPKLPAVATIIESKLDKNRGPVHTVVVNKGTLKIGDPFVMGVTYGKVRAMVNDHGRKLLSAGPSVPVELIGASELCESGEVLQCVESDKKARQISITREAEQREKRLAAQHTRLENVLEKISDGEMSELKLVIKGDAQGSVDGVKELLSKLSLSEVRVRVIHDGIGGITESDVTLADASDAIVVGFNVRPTEKAKVLAEQSKIDLRLYTIIYEITDDIKAALQGLLKPKFEEKTIGRAEVRNTFKISKIGTIAGCMVSSGLAKRNTEARLIRDSVIIYTGALTSLKRFKDDAKEVQSGYECGITLDKFNDIKIGDVIEMFAQEEVAREAL